MNHNIHKQVCFALRCPDATAELMQHLRQIRVPAEISIAWGERRIPLSKGRHHGGYVSLYPMQPVLRYESDEERRALKHLASLKESAAVATQPLTVRFKFNEKLRHYTPDALIVLTVVPAHLARAGFDQFTLVEVKPLDVPEDQPDLWRARRKALREALGMPLVRFPLVRRA